ncbi:MAG: hypothetical protein PWQ41_270 [Bacillota bacterium]|nr:hypothetical protein [Bacillota bacterium]MDK2924496.1 hypothetical protein [Bacillota bacterium]
MMVARLSSKDQLVIPAAIREKLGLGQGGQLKIDVSGNKIILEPIGDSKRAASWESWRGVLRSSTALKEHLEEHRTEVARTRTW